MHEDFKIQEAEYHLSRMQETAGQESFRFELSAFLSSARSVLQYALKEAETRTGGQAWYDREVGVDPIVRFLKSARDGNIHVSPVTPKTDVQISEPRLHYSLSDAVPLPESGELAFAFARVELEYMPTAHADSTTTVEYTYKFRDWAGAGDVPTLCTRYLTEIKRIVSDGCNRGFLTQ